MKDYLKVHKFLKDLKLNYNLYSHLEY